MTRESTYQRPHCKCGEDRSNEFIYRHDPYWWSCMDCDGRVQPLTYEELLERYPAPDAWAERYGEGR